MKRIHYRNQRSFNWISCCCLSAWLSQDLSASAQAPMIWSFGPRWGQPTEVVRISGQGFTQVKSVRFGQAEASFTNSIAGDLIVTKVPMDATTGPIVVGTASGEAASSQVFRVLPPDPPQIFSVGPLVVEPGQSLDIRGTNLLAATRVDWNDLELGFIVSIVPGGLIAFVPNVASNGPITVTTPFGKATSREIIAFKRPGPPVVSGFDPQSGPEDSEVEILGSDLRFATGVKLNDLEIPFGGSIRNPGSLMVQIPPDAVSGAFIVTTPYGTFQTTGRFTVTAPAPPLIDYANFWPDDAWNKMDLGGRNLRRVTVVRFNSTEAAFSIRSPILISAVIPTNFTSGTITVESPFGMYTYAGFRVPPRPVPIISYFFPSEAAPGQTVQIIGVGVDTAVEVLFNGAPARFRAIGTLVATVPPDASTGPITVRNRYGSGTSAQVFKVLRDGDLRLLLEPPVDSFSAKDGLSLTVIVTNQSPFLATNVVLTARLDQRIKLVSASPSQGSCATSEGLSNCSFGLLAGRSSAKLTLQLQATESGKLGNLFGVSWQAFDGQRYASQLSQFVWALSEFQLPPIAIDRSETNRLTISWFGNDTMVALQAAERLSAAGAWVTLDVPRSIAGPRVEMVVPQSPGAPSQFFRLARP